MYRIERRSNEQRVMYVGTYPPDQEYLHGLRIHYFLSLLIDQAKNFIDRKEQKERKYERQGSHKQRVSLATGSRFLAI